jgi:serine/threonine protein phosphatase PrpC
LLQAQPHALAERLGMGREASGFGLAVSVVREFALLAIERQQSSLGVPSAALVLAQRHDVGKVGFREPLYLLVQPRSGAAQVGPSRLHLLRQPVPAASPLHRMHDHLRRGEHLAQVAPDQLLQRSARDVPRRAMFARRLSRDLRLGSADVVVVSPPHVPP